MLVFVTFKVLCASSILFSLGMSCISSLVQNIVGLPLAFTKLLPLFCCRRLLLLHISAFQPSSQKPEWRTGEHKQSPELSLASSVVSTCRNDLTPNHIIWSCWSNFEKFEVKFLFGLTCLHALFLGPVLL